MIELNGAKLPAAFGVTRLAPAGFSASKRPTRERSPPRRWGSAVPRGPKTSPNGRMAAPWHERRRLRAGVKEPYRKPCTPHLGAAGDINSAGSVPRAGADWQSWVVYTRNGSCHEARISVCGCSFRSAMNLSGDRDESQDVSSGCGVCGTFRRLHFEPGCWREVQPEGGSKCSRTAKESSGDQHVGVFLDRAALGRRGV